MNFRAPIAHGLAAGNASAIDREKRIVTGYAVITRGEALGHGLWIDNEMLAAVVKAGNATPDGVKCRFTHPGLCADGLGKFLGRAKNFSLDGEVVRADLCISDVADSSPSGKLGTYVMDLAEKDPKAFGTSIVFDRDTNAEDKFLMDNGATAQAIAYSWGGEVEGFTSPDPDNAKNYRHARLKTLNASDVVDEPAANEGGFFSRADELASRGDAVLSFVLGLTEQVPDALAMGGMEPARAKAFVQGFLNRRKLTITEAAPMPKTTKKLSDEDDEKTKTAAGDPPPAADDDEDDDEEEVPAAKASKKRSNSMARLAALRAEFKSHPNFAMDQFEKGNNVEQAKAEFNAMRVKELEAEVGKLKGGAAPIQFGGENPGTGGGNGEGFMALAKELAAEKNISLGKAIRQLSIDKPELHAEFKASQKPRKVK